MNWYVKNEGFTQPLASSNGELFETQGFRWDPILIWEWVPNLGLLTMNILDVTIKEWFTVMIRFWIVNFSFVIKHYECYIHFLAIQW